MSLHATRTVTETLAVPVPPTGEKSHLVLRTVAAASTAFSNLSEALNELFRISCEFGAWGDPLSLGIRKILDEIVMMEMDDGDLENPDEREEKIKEGKRLLAMLRNQVLVDPICGRPFVAPLMEEEQDGGWDWEGRIAGIFIRTCDVLGIEPVSPFSNKNLRVCLKSHAFAQELINWYEALPTEYKVEDAKTPPVESEDPLTTPAAAGAGRESPESTDLEQVFDLVDPQSLPPIEETPSELEAILGSLEEERKAKIQAYLQERRKRWKEERVLLMTQQYQGFQRRAAGVLIASRRTRKAIAMDEKTEAQIVKNAEEKAAFEEAWKCMQAKADAEAAKVIEEIDDLRKTFAFHEKILQERIARGLALLQATREELRKEQERNIRNQEKITALENRCSSLEHSLNEARAQINGCRDSGGGCIIM